MPSVEADPAVAPSRHTVTGRVGLRPHKAKPSGRAISAPAETEVESMPKRHLEAPTEEGRAKARKALGRLKDLTVQPVTRARYVQARESFYGWLHDENLVLPTSAFHLDSVVSDYLGFLWASGKGRSTGSNILAALQDAQPHLRGKLKQSWRLMKAWVANEIPNRAPPMPLDVLHVMVGHALFKKEVDFALSLLLAFHGLLRTGELLNVKARHVSVSSPKGLAVLSLGLTKSGKRQGAAENVTIHGEDICRRLYAWKKDVSQDTFLAGTAYMWRKKFADTLQAVHFQDFDFRPYSLPRGGATYYFQLTGSFDKLLTLGRWVAISTARIYVNDGLAILAEITLPWTPSNRNFRSQYLKSFTQPLSPVARTKRASNPRGRWNRAQKDSTGMCVKRVKILLARVWPASRWLSIHKISSTLGLAGCILVKYENKAGSC